MGFSQFSQYILSYIKQEMAFLLLHFKHLMRDSPKTPVALLYIVVGEILLSTVEVGLNYK